jgi:hypothetical protein
MATIPTYQRQRGIPASTGVGAPPVVLLNNPVARAVGQFSQVMGGIGENLRDAQRKSHVSASVINATLRLTTLRSDFKKLRGPDALEKFPGAAQLIYDEASSGLVDPVERRAFDEKWQVLVANSQIAIQSAAAKRSFDELASNLVLGLDSLARGYYFNTDGAEIEVSGQIAIETGIKMIDEAIAGGVIDAQVGAAKKLKFIQQVAEEGVLGWMNRPDQELIAVHTQMSKGKIDPTDSPGIQKLWDILDEKTKTRLKKTTLTNISSSLALDAKLAAQKEAELTVTVNRLLFEFWVEETSPERRRQIFKDLADNSSIDTATYMEMLAALSGITTQFDDEDKIRDAEILIVTRPGDVTLQEIIGLGFSVPVTRRLMTMFESASNKDFARAIQMLQHHPVFVPKSRIQQLLNSRGMNVAQAEIWSIILEEAEAASEAGLGYDATTRALELINQFKEDGEVGTVSVPLNQETLVEPSVVTIESLLGELSEEERKQLSARLSARSELEAMGILSREDFSLDWWRENNVKLEPVELQRITDLINVAFPK